MPMKTSLEKMLSEKSNNNNNKQAQYTGRLMRELKILRH
jgi:hypothetical protein